MSIPFATTTITIIRPDNSGDGYAANPPAPTAVASGVRAVIGAPTATTHLSGGQKVDYTASLRCDPVDLQPGDLITATDGTQWFTLWARQQTGIGLSFTMASLRLQTGAT